MKHRPRKPGLSGRGKCGACAHPKRELIDFGLITMTPKQVLAQRFDLSVDCLSRHAKHHLPPQIRAALMTQLAPSDIDLEALQRSESESLLASLIAQRARLSTMAQAALEHDLPNVAVRCENAVLANLELVSRLLGQLVSRSEASIRPCTRHRAGLSYWRLNGNFIYFGNGRGIIVHDVHREDAGDWRRASARCSRGVVPPVCDARFVGLILAVFIGATS